MPLPTPFTPLACRLAFRLVPRFILAGVVLLGGPLTAAVKTETWYHLSDNALPQDASGFKRHFQTPLSGFTYASTDAADGPLGPMGYKSMASLEFGRDAISGYWGINRSMPSDNVGIEAWVKPFGDGWVNPGDKESALIFATGGQGGLMLCVERINGTMMLSGHITHQSRVGVPAPLARNQWTHLALVRNHGVTTFYVNGVASGDSSTIEPLKAGEVHLGVNVNGTAGFRGLIDEARIFTFAPGEFQASDLLIQNRTASATPADTEKTPQLTYQIKTWQGDAGLPHNTITAIQQTTDGYLWVGTEGGVARFNGVAFTAFRPADTPALGHGRIAGLACGRDGALWITTEEGGLVRYAAGNFQSLQLPSGTGQSAKILRVAEAEDGCLWVSTAAGEVARWDGQHYKVMAGGSGSGPAELHDGRDGHPIISHRGVIFRAEKGALVPVIADENKSRGRFLCVGGHDDYWFFHRGFQSILRYGPDGKYASVPWIHQTLNWVNGACVDHAGRLWLAMEASGLVRKDPTDGDLRISTQDGLGSDDVRVIFVDKAGIIWVGTAGGGLSRLIPPRVTSFGPAQGIPSGRIGGLMASADGSLWAGVEGRGVCQFLCNPPQMIQGPGWALLTTTVMAEKSDGSFYAGNVKSGLWTKRMNQFNHRQFQAPGQAAQVRSLFVDGNDRLWVGTCTANRLSVIEGAKVRDVKFPADIPATDVCTMTQDPAGNLWAGTDGQGLLCLSSNEWRQFTLADGLLSNIIWSLHAEHDGALWVGTFGGGLSRVKNGKIATCTVRDGLGHDVITHIEDDGRGYLWFGSQGGIFRVKKQELNEFADGLRPRIHSVAFGLDDGMPSLVCSGGFQPAGCHTSDGRLWFPTLKGVAMVNPAAIQPSPLAPPVKILGITVDGEFHAHRQDGGAPMVFATSNKRFRLHFEGLDLIAPDAVHYRIRLAGVDADWVDVGHERVADYSQLAAGRYRFEVMACSRDGVWSEPATDLEFVLKPLWHQRQDLRLAAALILACGVASAIWWSARLRIRRKLAVLEKKRMLENERQRIAANIHDELGASLTRIALLSDLAREGASHGGVAHEIEQIHETANQMTRSMDEIVWAVDPEHDTLDSLASYLARVAQDLLGPAGLRCRLAIPAELPQVMLAGRVRHNLYLASKETLHNAIRHAGATEVRLAIEIGPQEFTIRISDNGKGLGSRAEAEPGRASSGHGLKNLTSRLQEIGGRCEVSSSPAGTHIAFHMPFAATPESSTNP